MTSKPEELVVLVTGATGIAGRAACSALAAAGHQVIAVARDADSLAALSADRVDAKSVDLADAAAVLTLATSVRERYGAIDGLVHLVGGWRGGEGFTTNTDEDWAFLSSNLIDTLRHATQAVHDDLVASRCGRAVIVSATAAAKPTAGNANYATAKAAAEAWLRALADSLRRNQSGRKDNPLPQTSAAVILVIKAIGDAAGFTPAEALASRIAGLFDADADELNGARIDLTTAP
ncbi:MAG: SDR family NAD(P)-dependent oxidoreductase [Actinomycetota bacterium]|nr:SDR family NAD(P)-dependent oxidoreductase [Actinomycetota bacterium]